MKDNGEPHARFGAESNGVTTTTAEDVLAGCGAVRSFALSRDMLAELVGADDECFQVFPEALPRS